MKHFKYIKFLIIGMTLIIGNIACDAPEKAKTEATLYDVNATWYTSNNEPFQLKQLEGKVNLVAMIFTSCQYACPKIVSDIKEIEIGISPEMSAQLNYVLISIDPEVDSPKKLTKFATQMNMDMDKWTLLQAEDDEDVAKVARLLGVDYKKFGRGSYSHSNIISLIDENGQVLHQQNGLGVSPDSTILAIENLFKP